MAGHDSSASRFPRSVLLLLLAAAGVAAYFAAQRGQTDMRLNVFASSPSTATSKPLIDALAPRAISTATFAMG
jgi:hypothetical protein